MTLLINGTTTPYVLKFMGLMQTEAESDRLLGEVRERITDRTQKLFNELQSENSANEEKALFGGADYNEVKRMVQSLNSNWLEKPHKSANEKGGAGHGLLARARGHRDNANQLIVIMLRDTVLRVVKNTYWE